MLTDTKSELMRSEAEYDIGKEKDRLRVLLKSLLRSKTGLLGLLGVLSIIFIAVFAGQIAPHAPNKIDLDVMLLPPSWMEGGNAAYFLGTDNLGRDLLSRIIYGSRVSLIVGICAVAVAGTIGAILGVVSGYYGGIIDHIIMRLVEALLALPNVLLVLVIISVFKPGVMALILVLGCTTWTKYTRFIRGEVLSLREREFVKAAYAIGTKTRVIMFKHMLANCFSTFIVICTINISSVILTEASLSFLGLGVQPPTVSWGYMLSEGRMYLATSWWLATFPGIAITLTVLSIIFFGDWLRDLLDPRSQGRRS
ncbi:peptide/nickel transport system permease protein [Desulfitobacterium sp. LBE]|uniref:ABC transporter permease n=1 Tax=Desulfitobacterium sp. LBE TaxID=884086 RepID=UPI0011998BB1|nr:ABC transporter permease [Desulfitobacterium sp. LBE]TWH58125.1 peptide/nickel transport system permease protein [Desulfitobacterium sp. LBE]